MIDNSKKIICPDCNSDDISINICAVCFERNEYYKNKTYCDYCDGNGNYYCRYKCNSCSNEFKENYAKI